MPDLPFGPQNYDVGWVWIVVASVVIGVGAIVGAWLVFHRRPHVPDAGESDLERLRRLTLAELDDLRHQVTRNELSANEAVRRASSSVRRFVGIAADVDTDFQSAREISVAAMRDHRLVPCAKFAEHAESIGFDDAAPRPSQATDLITAGEKVVETWR